MLTSVFGGVGGFLLYALAFLFVLTVVVFVHELGHFLVARWCNVEVSAFSIGFGREIYGFNDRHGTRWRIGWIPLGGYVKFLDDDNPTSTHAAEAARRLPPEQRERAFHTKPVWQRASVVAAGPLANFLLAIVIFSVGFMIFGQRTTVPRVDEVEPGSAAASAGFKAGDIIVALDGRAVTSFSDVQRRIATGGGRTMEVEIDRGGARITLQATPRMTEVTDPVTGQKQEAPRLGIKRAATPEEVTEQPVNPVQAIVLGTKETTFIITATLEYLGRAAVKAVTRFEAPKELGGPARIADIAGKVAKKNVFDLIYLVAFISVSVGLINLFPIPLLDGGHLMFYAIEAVRGRPLSERTQEMSFKIGIAVVLSLMLLSTWNDIPTIRGWFS